MKRKIIFCWCPGHGGVKGTEEADNETKQAIGMSLYKVKIFCMDCKGSVESHIKKIW